MDKLIPSPTLKGDGSKEAKPTGLNSALINAVNKKFGIGQIAGLDEVQLKIAGAIAQAGIENSRGTFATQRQKAFISFIENQTVTQYDMPDKVWSDLFDVLVGVLMGQ